MLLAFDVTSSRIRLQEKELHLEINLFSLSTHTKKNTTHKHIYNEPVYAMAMNLSEDRDRGESNGPKRSSTSSTSSGRLPVPHPTLQPHPPFHIETNTFYSVFSLVVIVRTTPTLHTNTHTLPVHKKCISSPSIQLPSTFTHHEHTWRPTIFIYGCDS